MGRIRLGCRATTLSRSGMTSIREQSYGWTFSTITMTQPSISTSRLVWAVGGGRPSTPPPKPPARPQPLVSADCVSAAAGFAISLATDVSYLTGIGETVTALRIAGTYGVKSLATGLFAAASVGMARASEQYGDKALVALGVGSTLAGAKYDNYLNSAITSTSLWDLVPVVGTYRAGRTAWQACAN